MAEKLEFTSSSRISASRSDLLKLPISFSAYGNKEEFEAFVMFEFQTSKGAFARYLSFLSFNLLYGKSLLFSWTRIP